MILFFSEMLYLNNSSYIMTTRFSGVANGYGSATFGEGTGRIWLDELSCLGTETTLLDCRHNSWGDHDCDHDEDASVRCSNGML